MRGHRGKHLEGLIERSVTSGFFLVRIPDAHSFGGRSLRRRNPCDYIGSIDGHPLALEAKESEEESITRSKILQYPHQYDFLCRWNNAHIHHIGGFAILTGRRFLTWVPVSELERYPSHGPQRWGDGQLWGIRGIDLEKEPLDWKYLILGDRNGSAKSSSAA